MDGYFAANSAARRVMSKRAVGSTWGQHALMVGALEPRLFLGTAAHTAHRATPWRRLALTGRMFETVFLGTTAEADRALAFARRRHDEVHGELTEDAGPGRPAGTRYDAYDAHLMFLTVACAFDAVVACHDAFVGRLSGVDRAELWQDFVRFGELFGMPRDAAPAEYADFRVYFDGFLNSDERFLTDEARRVGRYLAGVDRPYPAPPVLRPGMVAIAHLVRGSLPASVRDRYGIRWSAADAASFRVLATGLRAAHRRGVGVPPVLAPVLRGRTASLYDLIAGAERARSRRGRTSMPGVSDIAVAR